MYKIKDKSLKNGIRIQLMVIYALIMREVMTRYGRDNIGFLWLLGEPLMFTTGIIIVWTLAGAAHGHEVSVIEFAITGYSSVILWRNSLNRAVNGIQPNFDLLVHKRVTEIDIIVSRVFLEVIGASLSFAFLSLSIGFLGYMEFPYNIGEVFLGWGLLIWTSLSLSLIVAAISEISDLMEKIWHVATYLFFPLSGALFMVEWLSVTLQKIVVWIPMVNALEIIREGWFGPSVKAWYSISYLIYFNTITLFIGLYLMRRMSGKIERR